MPDMGDISGAVSAPDQSTSAGGPSGGEGGGSNVDPGAGLSAPAMTFSAGDAKSMGAVLTAGAAIVASKIPGPAGVIASTFLGMTATALGLSGASNFADALDHAAHDTAAAMGWGIVQSTPGAILMSAPSGVGAAIGPNSVSVLDFNPAPAHRDTGSESNL
jgi:hypothetical protein